MRSGTSLLAELLLPDLCERKGFDVATGEDDYGHALRSDATISHDREVVGLGWGIRIRK